MDNKKILSEQQVQCFDKITYINKIASMLPFVSSNIKRSFIDYLSALQESEDNQEPASASQRKVT